MGLLASALYRISGRLRMRRIDIAGRPYLERYFLFKGFGVTAYLHRFVSGDDERNVHDHPWRWSFSLILTGGYVEERLRWFDPEHGWVIRRRRMFPLRMNAIGPACFHRITTPAPGTWTLFVHGPRVKGWGFLDFLNHRADEKPITVYHQPYRPGDSCGWHLTAPRARDVRAGA